MTLTKFPNSPAPAQDFIQAPSHFPGVPDEILQRFTSAGTWNDELTQWYKTLLGSLGDSNDSVTAVVNENAEQIGNIVVKVGDMTAEIAIIETTIITNYEVLSQRIVTVSALAGTSSNIKVQNAPPGAPALNDLWVNNTDPLTPITSKWNGAAWIEVTVPISVAAVAAEQTARITADGFLEGKYSLTVIAGNVVTGMNITSASGPGTNISSVIFRATDFQIYNGASGITMFSVSGATVNLAGVLTVSTSGKVYTGTGTYGNANTYFYVDSSNRFSLGANLTWDGATLTITGSISATTGTIGGWTVAATTLSNNNAVLDSAGQLYLGTANNIVYLSATDATYRLWIGNVAAASAAFSVTKAGVLFATGATISGNITATTGAIGGFSIGSDYIRDSADSFGLASTITGGNDVRFWAGAAFASRTTAPLRFYEDGTGVIAGFSITSDAFTCGTAGNTFTLFTGGGGTPYILFGASLITTLFLLSQSGFSLQNTSYNATVDCTNSGNAGLFRVYNNGAITITCTGSTGDITATTFTGSGASLTSLNASNVASGTLSNSRLPSSISVTNLTATSALTVQGSMSFSVSAANAIFDTSDGTVTFRHAVNHATARANWGTTTNHSVEIFTNNTSRFFFGSDGNFKTTGGDFRKSSSDNWTPILYDGTSQLEFQASGGQIFGRINGGSAILLG